MPVKVLEANLYISNITEMKLIYLLRVDVYSMFSFDFMSNFE